MAKVIEESMIQEIFKTMPHILKFPVKKLWFDYDEDADVLYIRFKRPQKATDSEMLKNGIIVRYKNGEVVGITILEASKRR